MLSVRFHIVFSILLFIFSAGLKAQDQDKFCTSTDPATGEITLIWQYDLFSSFSTYTIRWGTTLVPTDSITIPVTGASMSQLIAGTNGLNTKYYFHLTGYGSIYLDAVFRNILLSFSPPATDIAHLSWNTVYYPDSGQYSVQRYENTSWNTIARINTTAHNIGQLTYNDTISYPYCIPTNISYRISFQKSGSPCNSLSNEAKDSFSDQTLPADPTNEIVSVYQDPSGAYYPEISWTKSVGSGIAGYIIYRQTLGFDSITFVGPNSTSFIDKSVDACTQSYQYALAAFDSCSKPSPGTFAPLPAPHNIIVNLPAIDPCDRKARLSWTEYSRMPGGLMEYRIYRQVDGANFKYIASSSLSTNYDDSTTFINGSTYTYVVRAISQSGADSSTSCPVSISYNGPVIPDTLYLSQVSVVNNSYVEAKYYYSPANRVIEIVLERSDNPTGPFVPVDTLTAISPAYLPTESKLEDHAALVGQESYYYRLAMIDTCKKVAMYSFNLGRTILLTCAGNGTSSNSLDWNDYSEWYSGVDRYTIYRLVNGVADPNPLATETSSTLQYTDLLQGLSTSDQVCYYVKASETTGNPMVPLAASESNIACSIRDAMLFMPNAFRPDGVNIRYRPVFAFVDPASFQMEVFNKWGQMIFNTKDIYNGWDGNINGSPVTADVFLYYITYRSMTGESFTKRGLFTLVR
ncbi:MAG: gliding motility-associated C-terminal domain-containing protein [Bacteroidetes bacterium]|nr:gliding motility-associated C-terminal domain-containing protein [Bacteroidota bacterium]